MRILITLNRRLDAAFIQMEGLWLAYKDDRTPENFNRYLRSLRRCRTLHSTIKTLA